ncbi:MAG: hypothetical protein OEV12_02900 [Gammaproteobacteria bacterium]|jgi:hypothetical protein|nr:hypothetical protein [Gammaproteobacteria bacterium]MDH3934311.1 hypothetical protein [Gammaproteobacteria bacterium]MDH3970683.1 hypothetical protein [Gammaproteobacteria bacterium]MDH3985346.1 hypothetical protein [Gammaproteobacteria bacterium]
MELSTQTSVTGLWLTLLLVFALCASAASPAYLAEVQLQQVELGLEFDPDSFEDDETSTGFVSELLTKELLPLSLSCMVALSVVGSDAYPSITLHGPPVPGNIV